MATRTSRMLTIPARIVAAALLAAGAVPAAAQVPVVQALPSPAATELRDALRQLARSPANFDALIAAGRASLALDDVDAAIGFFGRADSVRPGDPRVRAGLASAKLKSDNPVEALQLFEQAAQGGAAPVTLAAERGLAFDLVGDNASAQMQYRLALTQGPNPEVSRRLALSQAIAGDRKGFEATLLPMLQRNDMAAFRARAFGLAIMGDEAQSVSIVETVMPRELAARIKPYLAYMPRLTRAQQAAAANLGAFPRAAQIGRDDPRLAAYTGARPAGAPAQGAGSRLAPAGEPLGPRAQAAITTAQRPTAAQRRQQRETERRQAALAEQQRKAAAAAARKPAATVARASPPPVVVRQLTNPSPPPPPAAPASVQPAATRPAAMASPPVARTAELPPVADSGLARVLAAQQSPVASSAPGPTAAVPASAATPPVQIAFVPPASATPAAPQPVVQAVPEPVSLAEAFAEFAAADANASPAVGAVDITRITPRRELPPEPKAAEPKAAEPKKVAVAKAAPPPPKPKAPSRVWVQVATGKDLGALAFDWRRFGKEAPALLGKRSAYTAKWGVSRRLLTGPFDSQRAAAKFVADLKTAGVDAFTFTSSEGEEIAPLK
ncbi:hypothetical protein GRI40_04985 [Altererythrobacter aerius]|uniref:SPOR domain-containing protein n=1 Tax=Tsuneonella aeria TaxID=1837929 RepID=A0A6I4TD83_9SPHN|nr:SPOR domain-containing protein [Tsuneonella aeria]MXO74576.1 hypothetical protein [Tsuneonella aeria]